MVEFASSQRIQWELCTFFRDDSRENNPEGFLSQVGKKCNVLTRPTDREEKGKMKEVGLLKTARLTVLGLDNPTLTRNSHKIVWGNLGKFPFII